MWKRWRWTVALVVAGTGAAAAQPAGEPVFPPPGAPAPPVEPPVRAEPPAPTPARVVVVAAPAAEPPVAAHERYPAAITARPLLLPIGSIEGSAGFGVDRTQEASEDSRTYLSFAPTVRYATPAVEIAAGAAFGLYSRSTAASTIDVQTLGALSLAARRGLRPDLVVGGEMAVHFLSKDERAYSPRLTIAQKRHLGARSALELSGLGGVDHQVFKGGLVSPTGSFDTLVLGTVLRVQAQLAAVFGVEGRATLSYLKALNDVPNVVMRKSYLSMDYGIRGVLAVTCRLDLVAGFDVLTYEFPQTRFTVGVVVRRVP